MIRVSELKLSLDHAAAPEAALRKAVAERLALPPEALATLCVFKRSFDARKAALQAVYIVDVSLSDPAQEAAVLARFTDHPHVHPTPDMAWHPAARAPEGSAERPVIVGFGPCGIFAALALAQMGFRPIVIERGRPVRERTQDTWGLWRRRELQPESNVQFGEGGAGTFSDGKLYSQIRDPDFYGRKVMEELVHAGAPEEILWVAHPHIGTFKLVKVVEHLRAQIIALGGEVRFQHRMTRLLLDQDQVCGVEVLNGADGQTSQIASHHVVIALGHSARDSFAALYEQGVAMEAKPFSIGFRVEHPQGLIDRARWGRHAGHPLLGAADYKLVHHASNGRAVYSFCMCPGGTVVAATSEPGRVVTNGMSQYSRNERNANAALVVGITPEDYPHEAERMAWAFEGELGERLAAGLVAPPDKAPHPLSGVVLQRALESHAYALGGASYEAPGQLVGDFIQGQTSSGWGEVNPSYKPGVRLGSLHSALPDYAIDALREALPQFGKKIRGFDRADAVLTGVETRTSSPLRIQRDAQSLQSINVAGLYPAGEGAGFAGGILSAAVDGLRVAQALAQAMVGQAAARADRSGAA